ncbi:MAG: TIR domain-containing protein [Pseudomonadota bacterium]
MYNLFISHSWAYTDSYEKLISMLNDAKYFTYKNYSVPKDDPVHTNGTDKELYAAILRKMQPCHAILVLAGVYSSYSKWRSKELKIAQSEFSAPKKIIAIQPWGAERTSIEVKSAATDIVAWNTSSILGAIRTKNLL